MTNTKNNDFIEIEFNARLKETGILFDTTNPDEAKKAGLPSENIHPVKLCIGQSMVIKGLDNALQGKEIGKDYHAELQPEEAFGNRNPNLVRTVSEKIFLAQQMYPQRGMVVTLDNMVARIASVSGGRVLVDFNNPLSGKVIVYDFKIKRLIEKPEEKVEIIFENLFKIKKEDINIKTDEKIIGFKNKELEKILDNKKAVEELEKKIKELSGIEFKLQQRKPLLNTQKSEVSDIKKAGTIEKITEKKPENKNSSQQKQPVNKTYQK